MIERHRARFNSSAIHRGSVVVDCVGPAGTEDVVAKPKMAVSSSLNGRVVDGAAPGSMSNGTEDGGLNSSMLARPASDVPGMNPQAETTTDATASTPPKRHDLTGASIPPLRRSPRRGIAALACSGAPIRVVDQKSSTSPNCNRKPRIAGTREVDSGFQVSTGPAFGTGTKPLTRPLADRTDSR